MTDNVYSTICPGCNFGCGLYIRENGTLEVDFRKSSPANAGKLCRFGMGLPKLFAPTRSMVDSKETTIEEAAKEAARRISASKGSVAFLSLIHISEPTRLGMISYAVFCLKKKK